ncbi:MAG TPA: outer membrane beta-barrel protein [Kofleriaceae bacterium]|jgi:hypothetical protein
MLRPALVGLALVASSAPAFAGVYLGLGVGSSPSVGKDAGQYMTPDSRSGRILAGYRFGHISIEGEGIGFGANSQRCDCDVYQLAASVKYSLPLSAGFEAFGKLGLEHMSWNQNGDGYDWSGNGYGGAAGLEYRFSVALTSASIFVDYEIHHATLSHDANPVTMGLTPRMFTLGLTLGL